MPYLNALLTAVFSESTQVDRPGRLMAAAIASTRPGKGAPDQGPATKGFRPPAT